MAREILTENHVPLREARELLSMSPMMAHRYARNGAFGKIYTDPATNRIYIDIRELMARFPIDPAKLKAIKND